MKLGLVEQGMYREQENSQHGCLKVQWLRAEKRYWNKPLMVTSTVSKTLTQDIVELQCHHVPSSFNKETTTFSTTNFWFIVSIGLPWWFSWWRTYLQCRRPWFDSWIGKFPWRKGRLPSPVFLDFPGGTDGKESACSVGDLGSIPGSGRSPGWRHGNPFQYSCWENPHGQRRQVGNNSWGHKELDMTERLSTAQHCIHINDIKHFPIV